MPRVRKGHGINDAPGAEESCINNAPGEEESCTDDAPGMKIHVLTILLGRRDGISLIHRGRKSCVSTMHRGRKGQSIDEAPGAEGTEHFLFALTIIDCPGHCHFHDGTFP